MASIQNDAADAIPQDAKKPPEGRRGDSPWITFIVQEYELIVAAAVATEMNDIGSKAKQQTLDLCYSYGPVLFKAKTTTKVGLPQGQIDGPDLLIKPEGWRACRISSQEENGD